MHPFERVTMRQKVVHVTFISSKRFFLKLVTPWGVVYSCLGGFFVAEELFFEKQKSLREVREEANPI